MRNPDRPTTWGRLARGGLFGVSVLLLAGCATGYSFVQPDAAGGGGYYTSDGPYTGQGYYDDYGTGPYYPGTSGWGYYNGTWPYSDPYGWYGGYGYGQSLGFNLGISNVWGFPGYWGPWYSANGGCYDWYGCGGWRHRHHNRHEHASDQPKPWLKPDHPPVPPQLAHGSGNAPSTAQPARPIVRRPVEGFANRRPLESAAYAPHNFVRAQVRRPVETGINTMPVQRPYVPPRPTESAFANRREIPLMAPREPRSIAVETGINTMPGQRPYVPPRPTESAFANRREIPLMAPRESRPVSRPSFQPRTPPPVRAVASPPRQDRHTKTEVQ